jgi:hypothetical protein
MTTKRTKAPKKPEQAKPKSTGRRRRSIKVILETRPKDLTDEETRALLDHLKTRLRQAWDKISEDDEDDEDDLDDNLADVLGDNPMTSKTRERPRPSLIECTAYHEAGHAVAAIALRRAVTQVSIIPDDVAGSLGHCAHRKIDSFHPEWDSSDRTRSQVEREITTFLASGIAEAKFKGHRRRIGAATDIDNAVNLACCVSGDAEEAEKYVAWLYARTKNLLALPWHWRAVEKVAAALLAKRQISGRDARKLFEAALDEERAGLLDNTG